MTTTPTKTRFAANLLVILCALLLAVGCSSLGKGSSNSSPQALPDSIVTLLRDCGSLRKDIDERERVILKLTSDIKRLEEVINSVEQQIGILETGGADTSRVRTIHIVAVDRANVRQGPGMEFDVLARFALGTVLFQIDADASWYRVKALNGTAGWVHESVILAH